MKSFESLSERSLKSNITELYQNYTRIIPEL
jgi:hypothetical protein